MLHVRKLDDGILRVRGDDARDWVQGQVSNDVAGLAPGGAVYALIVSAQGKVLSDLWVLARADELLLVFPAGRLGPMQEHLDRFIIMEDVELAPLDGHVVVTAQGEGAEGALGPATFPCDRLGSGGRDAIVPVAEADAVVAAAIAAGGHLCADADWELARIRAARPRYGADFGEQTLPQEAGLRERALSFTKGCYQGQEAIVMLEHRGKPRRRLCALEIAAGDAPAPGTELLAADGTVAGTVTSAVADAGRVLALGLVKREQAEPGSRLQAGGRTASVRTVL